MLFVLSQYWPYLLGAALAGVATGWWVAARAGGRARPDRADEAGE